MTDLVKRREAGVVGELRVPRSAMHHARAELATMQRRGEIASAFNPREERNAAGQVEWVVNYVRLTDPPSKAPRRIAIATALLSGVAGIGALIYHARHVIAAALALALLAAAGFFVLNMILEGLARRGQGHCPGAWHR